MGASLMFELCLLSVIHRIKNGDDLLTGNGERISDLIVAAPEASGGDLSDHAISFEFTEQLYEDYLAYAAEVSEDALEIRLLEIIDHQKDGSLASVTCEAKCVEDRI